MNKEKIINNLKTEKLGRNLIYYEELESTQKLIKELSNQNVEEGTAIITDYQTAGIGTHDRKWYSNKGQNIAISFVLYPNCNIGKFENLTYNIAEIIVEGINELYGIKLDIKKPNDLMLNGKKIAGILTETKVINEEVKKLFIGIGFNVHQKEFPKEIEEKATSLEKEIPNMKFSREEIITKILNNFEKLISGTEEKIIQKKS